MRHIFLNDFRPTLTHQRVQAEKTKEFAGLDNYYIKGVQVYLGYFLLYEGNFRNSQKLIQESVLTLSKTISKILSKTISKTHSITLSKPFLNPYKTFFAPQTDT